MHIQLKKKSSSSLAHLDKNLEDIFGTSCMFRRSVKSDDGDCRKVRDVDLEIDNATPATNTIDFE